jgi:hypothetical protein
MATAAPNRAPTAAFEMNKCAEGTGKGSGAHAGARAARAGGGHGARRTARAGAAPGAPLPRRARSPGPGARLHDRAEAGRSQAGPPAAAPAWRAAARSGRAARPSDAALRGAVQGAACGPLTAQPPPPRRLARIPAVRRLQNEIRSRDRQLDVAQKEVTALKTQVAAKERCAGAQGVGRGRACPAAGWSHGGAGSRRRAGQKRLGSAFRDAAAASPPLGVN